jgi:hypothetical protein
MRELSHGHPSKLDLGIVARAALERTVSCENDREGHCGTCWKCYRRFRVLENETLHLFTEWQTVPWKGKDFNLYEAAWAKKYPNV